MPVSEERLQTVLDGYAKFLCDKDLALPKHQPYFVRWVREFLLFAQGHGGYLSACGTHRQARSSRRLTFSWPRSGAA
jgi:hypothetical protein